MSDIEKLIKLGISFPDNLNLVSRKLEGKHWSKYAKVSGFLRRKNIKEIDWYTIDFGYRADIVIRRILDEYLKGYEETMETRLMKIAEIKGWDFDDKENNFNIDTMDWSNENISLRKKKNNSLNFILDSIEVIKRKLKWTEELGPFPIIDDMNFGQKIALFSILNNRDAYSVISNSDSNVELLFKGHTVEDYIIINRKKYENNLDKMRILRNVISHVNILFTGDGIHKGSKVSELINSMSFLMGENIRNKILEKINEYKNNCINLYNTNIEIYNLDSEIRISDIFMKIIEEVKGE